MSDIERGNRPDLLCPDCGHHLHRPKPGKCQWYDCVCGAEAASPAALRSAAEAVVLAATTHTPEIAALNAVLARAASPPALDVPTDLLESLVDDDECRFDHHGGCQAHGYLSLAPDEVCPQAELKAIIRARLTAEQEGSGEPRTVCRDCGHWEHDPGSCDGLGHIFTEDRVPVVTDCACEVHDDAAEAASPPALTIEVERPLDAWDAGYAEGRAASPAALDMNAIEDILSDAESDGIIGPEYTPRRLAQYIVDSLTEQEERGKEGGGA